MIPKQVERLQTKISNIKRTLAAEKRKFGCYDDSRGLRYLPTKYFVQLQDYKEGLTYLRWFSKNFPDDGGFPDFLFQWTIILFKCGKTQDAAKKAFETFCANTYLFDKFFGRPITPILKWEGSNLEVPGFTEYLDYSSGQAELADFSEWLYRLITSEVFKSRCDKYIDIHKQLKTESDWETRRYLIMQARQLQETI
ncbi:MAG: hypothetical protein EKK39_14515 [Sphingobacteriales bacterium]|uniref:hypothetical protein n=1 Tax=Hydrotalea flava TaxID=714549 RepID=UPI000830D340|nr:hypothetical protein [Hydrotalea flava]RTL47327.1 MAG: hypothetical protein EKK39_14515 [Sphingobacteriales bacterium]